MGIRKAIIPAAGMGTRMLPAAKAVPKEMLPVVDRPTIEYVVAECAAAGIDDVLLITSRDKRAIEDHFDRNAELEARLSSAGKKDLLRSIDELCAKVKVHSVRQPRQRGLGDAVYQARRHVGNEPFLCLLGDTIFSGGRPPARHLAEMHGQLGAAVIGLEEVSADKVSRYGIVGGELIADGLYKLDSLVEKPAPENAPSRLAIAARYVLTPGIFACIEETGAGQGGEVQLTDALRLLLKREPIYGVVLDAARHDIGNPIDWLKTNLLLAHNDPEMWNALLPTILELVSGGQ
jgi:UTP--glucose-1-phosphate uridylyltransferase